MINFDNFIDNADVCASAILWVATSSEVFRLIPERKRRFIELIRETLRSRYVSVKTLQRLVGKCVSFSLAVPAARLFTREISAAISMGMRTLKPIAVQGALRDEIAHWLFLEEWDDPLPWREERHLQIELTTDPNWMGRDHSHTCKARNI